MEGREKRPLLFLLACPVRGLEPSQAGGLWNPCGQAAGHGLPNMERGRVAAGSVGCMCINSRKEPEAGLRLRTS